MTEPSEVISTTNELTESDTEADRTELVDANIAEFKVREQLPKGAFEDEKTEQAADNAPTVKEMVTPDGLHFVRPKASVTEYTI